MIRELGLRSIRPRVLSCSPTVTLAKTCRRHKGSTAPNLPRPALSTPISRSSHLAGPTTHQITRSTQSTTPCGQVSKNPRFARAVKVFLDSVQTHDIDAAWQAFMDLRDLERNVRGGEIADELRRQFPPETMRRIVRALLPAFKPPRVGDIEAVARQVYMYTKLLNYFLLASKLQKGERNNIAVLRLTMGQCMRRLVDPKFVRTTDDARLLVGLWTRISESSSMALQLTMYEMYMLVLGAWKSGRYLLVPYLYQMACRKWRVGDEERFQKLSALVLSFYVREHADSIDTTVVRSLLMDMNERQVRLSPRHYSMLILYFGKTRNLNEAMRVLEQAMGDPDAQSTEAIYYNLFRAFSCAFALQNRERASKYEVYESDGVDEKQSTAGEMELGADEQDQRLLIEPMHGTDPEARHSSECLQAAKICTWIFQRMTTNSVTIGFRTYRELIGCMVQFGMRDKAQRIFEFAMDSLSVTEVTAHFIAHYLHLIASTPHQRQLVLRGLIKQNENVAMAISVFSQRKLVDQFGIFDGNVAAFVAGEKRPAASERGGEFLTRFLTQMHKATRAAGFIKCLLAGNDPLGRFKGYNFPKLGIGGLVAVESELVDVCRVIHETRPGWLQHHDVIYNLLPALPGTMASDAEPSGIAYVRDLVDKTRNVAELIARLDEARIEGYGIEMVNQFMRVKYLGLTFQRYVQEKTVRRNSQPMRLFWPTFMYLKSNGPIPQDGSSPLASIDRGTYSRDIVRIVPDAVASWQHLVDVFSADPESILGINSNTIGVFSRIAIYAGDWEFGQRIWGDVLRLMGRKPGFVGNEQGLNVQTQLPLQTLRVYKNYLQFITWAALSASGSRNRARSGLPAFHVFSGDALVDMFQMMERNGVGVTSGLLCQGISSAFRVGLVDVGGALEQWQLHRERRGLAEDGFLQQYFGLVGIPDVPAKTPMMALVDGSAGCPRLSDFIARQIHRP
ncbi:hypothetical protein IW148_003277 [Coemansia sp. RSA 1199]|nr:hypothetical protein IW148_003277 [Coemansia sp. RSA 1199]